MASALARRRWRVLALCLALAGPAAARPYTVDDLLNLEGVGAAAFDPTGRRLVVEWRRPYQTAGRFDLESQSWLSASRLLVADRDAGGLRPLLPPAPGAGDFAGPFSPDGQRLVVYRLTRDRLSVGVANLASGATRWLNSGPELAPLGRAAQWRSGGDLLLLLRDDGALPRALGSIWPATSRTTLAWAAAAKGEATAAVLGSGQYAALSPAPARRTLVLVDAATGAVRPIAQGPFEDIELSPTGKTVAVLEALGDRAPEPGEPLRGGGTLLKRQLALIDLATGEVRRPLPNHDIAVHLLDWSPSGRQLLVFGRRAGSWRDGELLRVEGRAGRVEALRLDPLHDWIGERDGTPAVTAGWIGETAAIRARSVVGGRYDWFRLSPRREPVNLTMALTAKASQGAKPPGDLATSTDRSRACGASAGRSACSGRRPHRASEGFGSGLRLHIDAGPLGPAPGSASAETRDEVLAEAGQARLLHRRFRDGGPSQLILATGAGARLLLTLNEHLRGVELARATPLAHRDPSGQAVTSWLYLPPSPVPALAPLIVIPYPGAVYAAAPPAYDGASLTLTTNAQVLAGAGFAVLVPSLPYAAVDRAPARGRAAQLEAAVSAAVATGRVDPDRMAIWGHSFGGFAALAAASQSRRFNAVVASDGLSDLTGFWSAMPPDLAAAPAPGRSLGGAGWAEAGQAGLGAPPWQAAQAYVDNSPLYHADRIAAPVLLLHGDLDAIPVAQSQAMFVALQRQAKDAVLVRYAGEGHGAASPGNVRDLYGRVVAWLQAALAIPPAAATPPAPRSASSSAPPITPAPQRP